MIPILELFEHAHPLMEFQQRADGADILFGAGKPHDRAFKFNVFRNQARKALTLPVVAEVIVTIHDFTGRFHNFDGAVVLVLAVNAR
jgi:hypothetical protein